MTADVRRQLDEQGYVLFENNQKALLRPEVQAHLSPDARHILALDDPLNDELSANATVRSGFMT
jgi:hypothetical protein